MHARCVYIHTVAIVGDYMLYQVHWSSKNITYVSFMLLLLILLIGRFPKIEQDIKRRIQRNVDTKDIKVKPEVVIFNKILYIFLMIVCIIMILAIMQMDWT